MFWKFIIGLLGCKEKDYLKAIKKKENIYVIDIHKFVPTEEELAKCVGILKRTAGGEDQLSDVQKFKCATRWLNALYIAFSDGLEAEIPCERCPHYMKECGCTVPPQDNFKVLEKITGDGTVVSHLVDQRAGLL